MFKFIRVSLHCLKVTCVPPLPSPTSWLLHVHFINKMAEKEGSKPLYIARPPAVLFYHESMKNLAESIAEKCSRVSQSSVVSKVGKFIN